MAAQFVVLGVVSVVLNTAADVVVAFLAGRIREGVGGGYGGVGGEVGCGAKAGMRTQNNRPLDNLVG